MDPSLLDAMLRAAALTQGGDPVDATRVLREALLASAQPFSGPAPVDDPDGQAPPPPDPLPMEAHTYSGPAGTREYRLFLPPETPHGIRGLILMLHGCTQTPEDFARGTAMNAIAAREGLAIVYPWQTTAHNPNGCWNWFDPAHQHRDGGEAAILAGLAVEVAKTYAVPPARIFAAGLSAGGAMAAILGRAYPEIFSAIGVHSGLPAGAANDAGSAFAVMNGSTLADPFPLAPGAAHARVMVVHGNRDRMVVPANGTALFDLMRQHYPLASIQHVAETDEGLTRLRLTRPDGLIAAEYWTINALGHAWSGGDAMGSYTAPGHPDASEGFVRFFLEDRA